MRLMGRNSSSTLPMSIIFLLLLLLDLQYFPATTDSLELLPPVTFSSFKRSNTNNMTSFQFSEVSSTSQGALQVTPDTINNPDYLVNKSGRVLYNRPFTLWTTTTTTEAEAEAEAAAAANNNTNTNNKYYRRIRTASFNTSFTINIYHVPGTAAPGEGFAFLIAPSLDDDAAAAEPPINSHGGYLGLTNQTLDNNPSNRLVAIEFDTVKQPYDPDDNHVGLDINSVISNVTSPLAPFGIDIAPVNATNYTVWIDYDGGLRKRISVRMARQYSPRPSQAVLDAHLDLSEHVLEKSYFGFAASTGTTYQLNCVLAWNLTVEKLVDDGNHCEPGCDVENTRPPAGILVVAIGLPVSALVVVVSVLVWRYVVIKRRRRGRKVGGAGEDPSVLTGTLKSLPGTPREFEFKVLRKATHEFDEKMKLGQGGFGVVYKGVIPGENTAAAVKKFSRDDIKGQDDFLAELSIINRLRHKHLVRLLGWCHKNGMLLLVYEFMPNGSLEQHLFGGGPDRPALLTWAHRCNILAGVASALHYLHNEYDQMVVHRDIKSSNVLLDSNFNARLGDFGLARAIDTDKTSSYVDVELGGVAGTMGYIAPECFHTGRATRQSDVFAFGALVLEVVCSRRPRCDVGGFQFLVDWVWMLHREDRILEAVDPRLAAMEEGEEDAVRRLLLLGLACSHPSPADRPKTAAIVHNIIHSTTTSSSSPSLTVPPFKPSFVWPAVQILYDDDDDDETRSTDVLSPYYASSTAETPSGTTTT